MIIRYAYTKKTLLKSFSASKCVHIIKLSVNHSFTYAKRPFLILCGILSYTPLPVNHNNVLKSCEVSVFPLYLPEFVYIEAGVAFPAPAYEEELIFPIL